MAIVLSILHDLRPLYCLSLRRLVTPSVSIYCLSFTTSVTPSVSSYIVYPSRRPVTPSVSSWPLYCLSFTTSSYPFGIFLAIVLSILHDVPLPLRYLLGHYIVYPSRRLVTPSVSSWPLYCLSFTTSRYPFGIFWPLYCLSFTTSSYPFGIFLAIVLSILVTPSVSSLAIALSILHDVWLPLRYLLGHCIVYPSRRLFTPSVSSWPLYCLSFMTSGYPFGIFLAIVLSILHHV